jgi:hypothetical protein
MRRALLLLCLASVGLLAAGCESEHPAARVAGVSITGEQVEQLLEHAQEESKHEGRLFPSRGTAAYAQARRQALNLLIFHAELAQEAQKLGISVSDEEIEARLDQAGGEEEAEAGEEGEGGAFAEESIRGALLYQRLYRRLTQNIRISSADVAAYYHHRAHLYRQRGLSLAAARAEIVADLLTARRTAAMSAWVERMRRDFVPKITYGTGSDS